MIEEAKKFAPIYFKKNETSRLQLKESVRPTNYLPQSELDGETDLLDLRGRMQSFKTDIDALHNQRVGRLQTQLQGGEVVGNLHGYLVRSQVLTLG
jgi:hypothetical protein